MIKLSILLLACLFLIGCGKDRPRPPSIPAPTPFPTPISEPTPAPTATPVPTATPHAKATPYPTPAINPADYIPRVSLWPALLMSLVLVWLIRKRKIWTP